MADAWSPEEVEATVAEYFAMLELTLRGQPINKAARQRSLAATLNNRSAKSVSLKFQNISAILMEVGFPPLRGYAPLSNYQGLLADVVIDRLGAAHELELVVAADAEADSGWHSPIGIDLLGAFVPPPKAPRSSRTVRDPKEPPYGLRLISTGVDYLEREARNQMLGLAGEEFVVRLEQARLERAGMGQLAARVEHVSITAGDGLGYDVLSYETDTRERLIEVKTTKYAKETPFYVSRNEVAVSAMRAGEYHLYRVFDFRDDAKVFTLPGPLEVSCRLEPNTFRAKVA